MANKSIKEINEKLDKIIELLEYNNLTESQKKQKDERDLRASMSDEYREAYDQARKEELDDRLKSMREHK